MRQLHNRILNGMALVSAAAFANAAMGQSLPLTGNAAFGDWRSDTPGVSRLIKPEDLPKPGATPSAANVSHIVPRPPSAVPQPRAAGGRDPVR